MTQILQETLSWLDKYKNKTNCPGVVLGLSGGKDSTVVAMLAKKVWGDNVVAVTMPNKTQSDISDSNEIAEKLNLRKIEVNIRDAFCGILDNCAIDISLKAQTNIAPRIRMTTLYAIAQSLGYQVIGTGNRSEAFIGWTTKWGDSACDFNPIGNLTYTEVVAIGCLLAKEFGLDEKFIKKVPSDGLTMKPDEENFGFSYRELDSYILVGSSGNEDVDKKIFLMHKASEHKRNPIPMPEIF